jgi:CBASS immunity sensor of nucleotide second messenger signals
MVSTTTRAVVWARGAGRCHFCNTTLIGDLIAGNDDANFGLVAHIVAEQPRGPRGHGTRSALLADDPSNLMLMCYVHHKLIDHDEVDNYPEGRLLEIKRQHEERVAVVTDIKAERASHVVRYGAKIGDNESPVSFNRVRSAMLPKRYPSGGNSIVIEILGSVTTDGEDNFWRIEPDNLERQFNTILRPRITSREITHMSVFGLAPIPLLVKLGALLGDIVPSDVYQLHREPAGWMWAEDGDNIAFRVSRPSNKVSDKVALKLGISATITDDRVTSVLGPEVPIWSLSAMHPGNDVTRHETDLGEFRRLLRGLYDEIKVHHGEQATIHVFPAIPVSMAIEVGRVRMPKSDLSIIVYDNIRGMGFLPRLTIG